MGITLQFFGINTLLIKTIYLNLAGCVYDLAIMQYDANVYHPVIIILKKGQVARLYFIRVGH